MRNLSINSAKAGATKVDLLDSDNEMVRDRASTFVLALAGIKPEDTPSVSINIEVKAGYVIDLSEPGEIIDARAIRHVSRSSTKAVLPNAEEREPPIDVTP
jgi:hypothetical protein